MTGRGGGRDIVGGLHLVWVRREGLPAGLHWLTAAEREVLEGLRVEKRRGDWILGRWAAKTAVESAMGRGLPGLEILAADDGHPVARMADPDIANPCVSLSISHVAGVGLAAAVAGVKPLGCDVEVVEERSEAFVEDYFTEAERKAVERAPEECRALWANLLWSAKESALKALGEGLRLDTRSVRVELSCLEGAGEGKGPVGWVELEVVSRNGRSFRGFWKARDELVWTVLKGV